MSDRVNVVDLAKELNTTLGSIRQKALLLKLKMIDMSYTAAEADAIRKGFADSPAAEIIPDSVIQQPGEYVQLNVKVPDALIVELKQVEAQVYAMKMAQGKRAYASRAEILSMALGALRRELSNPRAKTED